MSYVFTNFRKCLILILLTSVVAAGTWGTSLWTKISRLQIGGIMPCAFLFWWSIMVNGLAKSGL